jgi:hypothetical protein
MSAIDYEAESDKRLNWMDLTGGPAQGGMTMLDYFAGKAMADLMGFMSFEEVAAKAYDMAEHMLAERNKRFTPTNTVRGVTGKTYG